MKLRRKLVRMGDSQGVTLPPYLEKGPELTLAGNRVLLMDPRGEISEDDLLAFLEEFIEPHLWPWLEKLRNRENASG